jgi:hypothetical protein
LFGGYAKIADGNTVDIKKGKESGGPYTAGVGLRTAMAKWAISVEVVEPLLLPYDLLRSSGRRAKSQRMEDERSRKEEGGERREKEGGEGRRSGGGGAKGWA